MPKFGDAYVEVKPDLKHFGGPLTARMRAAGADAGNRFNHGFSGATRHTFATLTKGAGVAAAAIGAGLVVEVKKAVSAYTETEKVGRQTNAVLRSTGSVAGVTAKHIGTLATAISRKSGIDDEAIQSTENLLLTFTNVRNEVGKGNKIFDQASRAVTDMSVALGQDGKSSAIQLGKALNDPIKGITALRRVGVSFTAQQQDQIKTLVQSGRTLDAQKMILREINREFGGSAAAQAQPIDRLKVSIGNIQEAIGSGFKPAIDAVATELEHLSNRALPDVQRAADDVSRTFRRKDISLSAKLRISEHALRRDLRPVITMVENEFHSAHIGDKVNEAITKGVPKMVDAAAKAAPHAAGAFIDAFKNSSGWGKLLTVAFLAKKLGAFGGLGRLLAGQVGKGALAGGIGSLKPIPVYVVNGPGKIPGTPGPTALGKAPGVLKTAAKTIALASPELAAFAAPLALADIVNRRSKLSRQAHALNDVLPAGRADLARQLDAAVKAGDPAKLRKVAAAIELTAQDMKGMGSASKSASREVQAVADNARDLARAADRARGRGIALARSISRITTSGEDAAREIRRLHDEISGLPTNVRVNIIARAVRNFGRNIPAQKKSTGGMVAGTGSGDHIPALLEPGEYVIRKKVVSKTGRKFFDDLNRGKYGDTMWTRGPRPLSYTQQKMVTNATAFQRFDDVNIDYSGLKAAVLRAARTPDLPQPILNARRLAGILQGDTGWRRPQTHIAEMHNHFTTPNGGLPDARFLTAQLKRELARMPGA